MMCTRFGVAMVMMATACGVDVQSQPDDTNPAATGAAEQDVVGGVFTFTLAPTTFTLNQVGVLDTGAIAIIDGSAWLSASVSLHCASASSIYACARAFDPAAPATSTTWCTPITSCTGDNTYTLPMSAVSTDAHHALALSVQRSSTAVTVNNAVLMAFSPGD